MWRGGCRSNISGAAPFVWRCLTGSAVAPFPHPAHRTGQADFPHPALGQDVGQGGAFGFAVGATADGAPRLAVVDDTVPNLTIFTGLTPSINGAER